MRGRALDSASLVACCCDQCDEHTDFLKCRDFRDYVRNCYWLLKRDTALWS